MTAFSLLEGLGLVTQANGVRITAAGRRALKEILRHHEGLPREQLVDGASSAA